MTSVDYRLIGSFILCTVNLGLAFLVFQHNRKALVNKVFSLAVLTIVGWILSISLALSQNDVYHTTALGRIAFAFASAIPFTLLWMFEAFSDQRAATISPRNLRLSLPAITCIIFIAFSLSPWIVADSQPSTATLKFIYGPLHPFFGAYFISCFSFGLYRLWKSAQAASGIKKLQFNYLLLGIFVGGAGAIATNLVIPLIWKSSRFSVLGPYFTLLLVSSSAHAIIRYRLMDVKLVIRNSVVYAIAIAVAAILVVASARLVTLVAGYHEETIPLIAAVLIAILVAIFFQPLKIWIRDSLNRYVYRETYDYQRTVREASRTLSTILDLQSLLAYVADVIMTTFKVEMVAVYLRDHPRDTFSARVFQRSPTAPSDISPYTLSTQSPLFAFLQQERRMLIRDETLRAIETHTFLDAAKTLESLGADLALPFWQADTLTGFLLIGPKLSGDPYFSEDIDLLFTLVNQAAVAIENAQLYRQVVLVNEYIENILATMESGVIAVAADGTITLFNSAAQHLTQLDVKDIRGGPLRRLPSSIAEPLAATLADGRPRAQVETLIQDAGGGLTPVMCSTTSLKDRSSTILGAVAVFSDLTRVKQLEGEKRRAERLASIGALASGIAHEIKNPLVAIRTFAELLPERFNEEDFHTEFSQVVMREIERIDDLVARLRGLARPPAQPLTPVHLRDPIQETLALLRGQLMQARVTVNTAYDRDLPSVAGDAVQLKQLFLNLFMNAIEAMDLGGELSIRLTARHHLGEHTVLVEVSDTGTGIPEHLLGKIFDPFVTTKQQGSGLGLSICRGIVSAHRAIIRAMNNANGRKGTTITIEFPALPHVAIGFDKAPEGASVS